MVRTDKKYETNAQRQKAYYDRQKLKNIQLPLLLVSEVIHDLQLRNVKGFNLSTGKYNVKPIMEVFDTTLRLLQEKINNIS